MLGKTHQLIALATVTVGALVTKPPALGIRGTLIVLGVTFLGALTPDIDHPTANLWKGLPAGSVVGRIARALLGGHRNLTHSLLAVWLLLRFTHGVTEIVRQEYAALAETVWRAYAAGYLSHLIADTFTDRGVPWLWPIRWHIGLPPGPPAFRVTTGSIIERQLVIPAVSAAILALWVWYWPAFRSLLGLV